MFGLQLRPAGGDLKQIFTSLPSSSNTPRQPKDSHLDATWIRTKVRQEIFMYGWPAFTFCGVCTFQSLPRQPCNQITGEVECNIRRQNDASAIQSRWSLHHGRIKQCHLKKYKIKRLPDQRLKCPYFTNASVVVTQTTHGKCLIYCI